LGAVLAVTAGAVWLEPVFSNLRYGQVNAMLMLLVVADFALAGRRRWPFGLLIGVAAAFKIVPGIFILYLLLTRRFRAAITSIVTVVVLTGLSFAIRPSDSIKFWFGSTFSNSDRVAGSEGVASVYNQSLHGVAARFFGDSAGNVVYYLLALVVLVVGMGLARAAYRSGEEAAGVITTALTALLISPISWSEHWVWLVPVLILLADAARRKHARAPIVGPAIPAAIVLVSLVWPLPGIEEGQGGQVIPRSYLVDIAEAWKAGRHGLVQLLASSVYPVIGLALLAGGWLALRARRRSVAGSGPAEAAGPARRVSLGAQLSAASGPTVTGAEVGVAGPGGATGSSGAP
jgi:alpha-1,2-mannosyltransferase